jgi:hypothetical protein
MRYCSPRARAQLLFEKNTGAEWPNETFDKTRLKPVKKSRFAGLKPQKQQKQRGQPERALH